MFNKIIYKDEEYLIKKQSYIHYWKYMNWYPYLYFNGVPGGLYNLFRIWGGPLKGV